MLIGKKLFYSILSTLIFCCMISSHAYAANLANEADVQKFINEMVKEFGHMS